MQSQYNVILAFNIFPCVPLRKKYFMSENHYSFSRYVLNYWYFDAICAFQIVQTTFGVPVNA